MFTILWFTVEAFPLSHMDRLLFVPPVRRPFDSCNDSHIHNGFRLHYIRTVLSVRSSTVIPGTVFGLTQSYSERAKSLEGDRPAF